MPAEIRLIDSNVLVYAYDRSAGHKNRIARTIVEKAFIEGGGAVTLQNLGEFFVVVTSKVEFPISAVEAKTVVSDLLESENWLKIDRLGCTVLSAIDLAKGHGARFWDAMIAACMIENGISTILTENVKDFQELPGLVVVNPFA